MPYKEKSSALTKKKTPPKKTPPKLKANQSRPAAKAEPTVDTRATQGGASAAKGAPKASHVYESFRVTGRGTYHQRKGAGKATANIKRQTAKAAPSAAAQSKAAAPGRKTYTDVAGFLAIKK